MVIDRRKGPACCVLPGSLAAVAGPEDPALRTLADVWWRQGGAAHEGVVEMDDPGPA